MRGSVSVGARALAAWLTLSGALACNAAGPADDAERRSRAAALSFRGAREVMPGLVTGGQPDSAAFAALAARGARVVLDIRDPKERRGVDEVRVVEALGMRYENLPITHATLGDSAFAAFRARMAAAEGAPMVVHCASGNRVGAVMIPYLMLDRGMSAAGADSLALLMGLSSPALRERAHGYVAKQRAVE